MTQATHILLIEDEQDIRDLISFQMKSEGHKVTAVESADKAVSVLERGEKIDLFIIDWMLPGSMSGLEFTAKLRAQKQYKDLPVIMVTALTQPEDIVKGLDAGADDYITKPFDLSVLQARVRVQLRATQTLQKLESTDDQMIYEGLKIEPSKARVLVDDQEIVLTSTEFTWSCFYQRAVHQQYSR
jgi:two-component system phosphate regulon response regulator PhoB